MPLISRENEVRLGNSPSRVYYLFISSFITIQPSSLSITGSGMLTCIGWAVRSKCAALGCSGSRLLIRPSDVDGYHLIRPHLQPKTLTFSL